MIVFGSLLLAWLIWYLLKAFFQVLIDWKGYKWFYWKIYLRMPNWRFARWLKYKINGRKCSKCGKNYRLQVHHKTYSGNKYLEWVKLWTLEVLCDMCHQKAHGIIR